MIYIQPEKSVRWLFYEKLRVVQIFNGFRIVHTMGNWLKITPTASKPLVLEDILYNFYLDDLQYVGIISGVAPSSLLKQKKERAI